MNKNVDIDMKFDNEPCENTFIHIRKIIDNKKKIEAMM